MGATETSTMTSGYCVLDCELLNRARGGKKGSGVCLFQSPTPKLIYDALKACDVKIISALPETWLVHLIRMADDDPEMTLVRLAKEEEASASPPARIWPASTPRC